MDVEPVFIPHQARDIAVGEECAQVDREFLESEHFGNLVGAKGGDRSGQQCRKVHVPDQQDFERKRNRRKRRLEKSRKARGHACNEQDLACVFDVNLFADVVPEGSSNLHRDTFAAGASAEQESSSFISLFYLTGDEVT